MNLSRGMRRERPPTRGAGRLGSRRGLAKGRALLTEATRQNGSWVPRRSAVARSHAAPYRPFEMRQQRAYVQTKRWLIGQTAFVMVGAGGVNMRKLSLPQLWARLLLVLQFVFAGAAYSDAPAFLKIEVNVPDYRDVSTGSSWSATGAFTDSGTLDREGEKLSAPSGLPAQGVLRVLGSLVASDGSVLTWSFWRRYFPTDDPTVFASTGRWHFVSGTGRYVGIRGHGEVTGTVNGITGEINDTFVGWVDFPPGLTL